MTEPLPLLKLRRGDEASTQVTVAHPLGLPPGGVLLANYLKNVPLPKRKPSLLAWSSLVFIRRIIKQSPEEDLE